MFDVGSPIQVAHAKVDLTLDGCVLREDYQGTDGHKGQSFTIYDVSRKVWHQSWVRGLVRLYLVALVESSAKPSRLRKNLNNPSVIVTLSVDQMLPNARFGAQCNRPCTPVSASPSRLRKNG